MKKITVVGLVLLIVGSLIYAYLVEDLSALSHALILGIMIGSSYALVRQFTNKEK